MKNTIIKDFDEFREVNESDMSLLGFVTNMAGDQLSKAVKEKAASMLLEYMGVPPEGDTNDPKGKSQWIREIFIKVMSNVSLDEMEDIVEGRKFINDGEFWAEKLAKALKEQIVDGSGPTARQVVDFIGVSSDGFIGRLISNTWREYILDEKRLEQTILGVWRLVTREEFIPQKDANEIYNDAVSKLTPEQRKKIEGSAWKYSVKQSDLLRRKGG